MCSRGNVSEYNGGRFFGSDCNGGIFLSQNAVEVYFLLRLQWMDFFVSKFSRGIFSSQITMDGFFLISGCNGGFFVSEYTGGIFLCHIVMEGFSSQMQLKDVFVSDCNGRIFLRVQWSAIDCDGGFFLLQCSRGIFSSWIAREGFFSLKIQKMDAMVRFFYLRLQRRDFFSKCSRGIFWSQSAIEGLLS